MSESTKLHEQIEVLRIEQGMTQKELAKSAGTQQSAIARLEKGQHEPSLSFLRRVASALNADVEVRLISQAKENRKLVKSEDSK